VNTSLKWLDLQLDSVKLGMNTFIDNPQMPESQREQDNDDQTEKSGPLEEGSRIPRSRERPLVPPGFRFLGETLGTGRKQQIG